MKNDLFQKLNEICDTQNFHVGLSFFDITSGIAFNRYGNKIIPSASTRKIFILAIYTYNVPEKIGAVPRKFIASHLISRLCRICFDYVDD